ncbi:MAG: ATP--guanido phosphotransferase [Clostridia bacterium]
MTVSASILKNDNIMSSRIRLARNVADYPMPKILRRGETEDSMQFMREISSVYTEQEGFKLFLMNRLSQNEQLSLIERHLISPNLDCNSPYSALILNQQQDISIMLNEEDHIRSQCIMDGFRLNAAYERLDELDNKLIKGMNIAYDKRFGFLTSCLTNVGTGLRASVMMFLPALERLGRISEVFKRCASNGITARGTYGEGSVATGFLYQISNRYSIGRTEMQLIGEVSDAVEYILIEEERARDELVRGRITKLKDDILRSKGIALSAYTLSAKEFIELFCYIKLGIGLGYIAVSNVNEFNRLLCNTQPYTTKLIADKDLNDEETDIFRADYVRRKLTKLL